MQMTLLFHNWMIMIIPIWVLLSSLSLVLIPIDATRTYPPLPSITDPVLPTEKKPPFSQIPTDSEAHSPGVSEIKVIHHEDLNKKILVALIIASTLLAGILLFLFCFWIFKQRHSEPLIALNLFQISNFALATTELHAKNKVKLSGASGYLAPEYLSEGKLTDKSDVYAFGVVLLELLIGRKPVEKMSPSLFQSIVTWAMPQLTDRSKLPSIVDPVIRDTMDLKHLYQVAAVAVLCVQPEPSYRPLITDVLHSFIPLVPVDLGGSLRA